MWSPAQYFPVEAKPLKMVAGLHRFGADFGQGELDRRFFQLDTQYPRYLEAKGRAPAERHLIAGHDPAAEQARGAALAWMQRTLAREAPEVLALAAADRTARDPFEALARVLQEDFAVLCATDDPEGRVVALDVRFPSGWRPERLGEASFAAIHAPVPGFLAHGAAARSMVCAMVERGPYVRFVWTLAGDDVLDHHPDTHVAPAWEEVARVWLRVERQVSIPFPDARTSLFLIRTYCYPFEQLEERQCATVLAAIDAMPSDVRAYKRLPQLATLQAVLARAGARRVI